MNCFFFESVTIVIRKLPGLCFSPQLFVGHFFFLTTSKDQPLIFGGKMAIHTAAATLTEGCIPTYRRNWGINPYY